MQNDDFRFESFPLELQDAIHNYLEAIREYESLSGNCREQPSYSIIDIPKFLMAEVLISSLGLPSAPRQIDPRECDYPTHHISRVLRGFVFNRDGHECRACGSRKQLSVDHIIPRRHDGATEASNLQTLCLSCNRKKATRMMPTQLYLETEVT